MHVSDVQFQDDIISKFVLTGFSTKKLRFVVQTSDNGFYAGGYELSLTLNGVYSRTPSGFFNCVHHADQEPHALDFSPTFQKLSFQSNIFLSHSKPIAEFQVFKFHEIPSLTEQEIKTIGLSETTFRLLTVEEPRVVFDIISGLQSERFSKESNGPHIDIARFVSEDFETSKQLADFLENAKKCTSNR